MDSDCRVDDRTDTSAVHQIRFDVDWPPGFVSAYVLDGDEPVLIDAGMPGDEQQATFEGDLEAIGLAPADIEHVVITHPHVDHVGMTPLLSDAGDPTVYAPLSARENLEFSTEALRETTVSELRAAGIPEGVVGGVADTIIDRRERVSDLLDPSGVDRWVTDGEQFRAGRWSFSAIKTPGHHQDHLCVRAERATGLGPVLFAGDMAVPTFRTPVLHATFQPAQRDGIAAYHDSLDRLSTESVDRVYPGHGPVHDDLPGAVQTSRRGLVRLCDRTERTLSPHGTSAVVAASERTDDVRDGPWVPEAVAALAHLEREGRAECRLEGGVRLYTPVSSSGS